MKGRSLAWAAVASALFLCLCVLKGAASAPAASTRPTPAASPSAATRPAATAPASRPTESPARPERLRRIAQLNRQAIARAQAGQWRQCKSLLEQILALDPQNNVAWYNMACADARLGHAEQAIAHLRTAVRHGYSDFRHMDRDPDLESLRASSAYRELAARNAEIQLERAERIRQALRERFGGDYICEVDEASKLIFATNVDRQTLEELKVHLTAYAEAMWNDLFNHRFEQYVTVVIPAAGDRLLRRMSGGGYYNHASRMLLARQIGMVLTHEFTHALHAADQDGWGQEHPIWIQEGMATLFESSRLAGGRVLPEPNHRLNLLQGFIARKQTIPWKELFGYSQADFMKRAILSYPQARYIMMYLHSQGRLAQWYDAYVAGFAEDATGAKAMEKVFGKPLEEIEADWLAWAGRLESPPVRLKPDQAHIGILVAAQTDGLLIQQVVPGSGAEEAGLRQGDVIVRIGGRRIVDPGALTLLVSGHEVGDVLEIRVRRDGEYVTVRVALQALPARPAASRPAPRPATAPATQSASRPVRKAA